MRRSNNAPHVHGAANWLTIERGCSPSGLEVTHIRRREFVGLLGGAAAATIWPLTSRAQASSAKVFRIGFLGSPSADSLPKRTEAFRAGLRDTPRCVWADCRRR